MKQINCSTWVNMDAALGVCQRKSYWLPLFSKNIKSCREGMEGRRGGGGIESIVNF